MTQYPQSESSLLRQQLESLLQEARRNEAKMRRFDQLQRRLIGAGSLLELIRLLLTEYRLAFGVEVVRLALVDPEYEVSRLLDEAADKDPLFADLMLLQSPTLIAPYFEGSERPCLQAFDARQHTALFPSTSWILASVALLPLVRHGALIGCLCIGSVDPERYDAGCGTDFLERLAEIVAISLESAMTQERLKRMGLTDGLTGVQNRRYFEHRLLEEISQSRRHAHDLACMFLDVDKFKHVNDDHGHQAGDAILRGVANVIQTQLRAGDTIARYGGEEFVVLLPRTAPQHVYEIAERIRSTISRQTFDTPAGRLHVSISIGVSMLPQTTEDIAYQSLGDTLVAAADRALYRAKQAGRNRVEWDDGAVPQRVDATALSSISFGRTVWLGWSRVVSDVSALLLNALQHRWRQRRFSKRFLFTETL